jgi:hypothetical protein
MLTAKTQPLLAAVCVALIGSSLPWVQVADTCPWGGDNSQSMRCFDCMVRIWTPQGWKLVNACKCCPDSWRSS